MMNKTVVVSVVCLLSCIFLQATAQEEWYEVWNRKIELAGRARNEGDIEREGILLMEALALVQAKGPGTIRHARNIDELAYHHLLHGRNSDSEPLYKKAVGMWERLLGPDQPRLATALQNLAVVRIRLEKYQEAEADLLRALEIWEKRYGPDHPSTVGARKTLQALKQRSASGPGG